MPFTIICYADGRTEPHRPDYKMLFCPYRFNGYCEDQRCVGPKCATWNGRGCGLRSSDHRSGEMRGRA